MKNEIQLPKPRSKEFYKVLIDTAPLSFERQLIMALIHSHPFYSAVKDKLCPWNPELASHRADFSVPRYNLMFTAIASFWNLFGSRISRDPIPQTHLRNIIIDWNNTHRIASDVAVELLEEIDDDFYAAPMSADYIENAVAGRSFVYWLETRLSKKTIEEITSKSRSMVMTMDTVAEIVEKYKLNRIEDKTRNSKGGGVMDRTMVSKPKLRTSIKGLDTALGGGFGFGEGSLIAGVNAAGKTVIACQLAMDFILDGRNVVYVTTEQPPEELVARMVSNNLKIKYDQFTQRAEFVNTLAAGEVPIEKEITVIPEWMWGDANYGHKLEKMKVQLNQHFLYMDWSDGGKMSVTQNFDSEMQKVVAQGFVPDVIIFDWIGGGLDYGKQGKDLRLLYQESADHLINHAKQYRRVAIALAQFDRTKAMGKDKCGTSMLSECKTMPNNMTNFIGISAKTENGTNASNVFQVNQGLTT